MLITVTIHFFESYLNHGTYLLCMTHVVLGECSNFYVNKEHYIIIIINLWNNGDV